MSQTATPPAAMPETATPKVHLRVLIISGQYHVFSFEPETTVGRVKELIWSMWPSEWTAPAQPPAPSWLKVLYSGRVLADDSTLLCECEHSMGREGGRHSRGPRVRVMERGEAYDCTRPADRLAPSTLVWIQIVSLRRPPPVRRSTLTAANNLPVSISNNSPTVVHLSVRSFSIHEGDDDKKQGGVKRTTTRSSNRPAHAEEDVGGCKCVIQ
jgi:hypothetical protein